MRSYEMLLIAFVAFLMSKWEDKKVMRKMYDWISTIAGFVSLALMVGEFLM